MNAIPKLLDIKYSRWLDMLLKSYDQSTSVFVFFSPLNSLLSCTLSITSNGGCPRGVMVKAMDCRIVVSEFVLQSRYYVHFRANTLGKGMNPLILLAMG